MQSANTIVADLFAGDPKGTGLAMTSMMSGISLAGVVAPSVGSALTQWNPRLPFLLSALVTAFESCLVLQMVPETLSVEMRKPIVGVKEIARKINPFAFLNLFFAGGKLALTAAAQFLHYLVEPRLLERTAVLVYSETLNWGTLQRGRYTSSSAASMLPGYLLVRGVVHRVGIGGALAFSTCGSLLQHVLNAFWARSSWQQYALLPLEAVRASGTGGMQSAMQEAAFAAGLRQSELQSYLRNLQDLTQIVGAFIWAKWYARCLKTKNPRRFFQGVAMLSALAGVVQQMSRHLVVAPKLVSATIAADPS